MGHAPTEAETKIRHTCPTGVQVCHTGSFTQKTKSSIRTSGSVQHTDRQSTYRHREAATVTNVLTFTDQSSKFTDVIRWGGLLGVYKRKVKVHLEVRDHHLYMFNKRSLNVM